MFKIIALVCSLAADQSGACREFVSDKTYPSLQTCEATLADAQKTFIEFLGVVYGLGPDQVKVELKCGFQPKV